MDVLGKFNELLRIVFRVPTDEVEVTVEPNSSTTYPADVTVELPQNATSDVLVGRESSDQDASSLKNKDLDSTTTRVQDTADNTKKARFDASSIHTSTTVDLVLPNSSDTLVGRNTTDTLTNKTIDSAVLDTQVTGSAVDTDISTPGANTIPSSQAAKDYADSTSGTVQTNLDNHINSTDAHDADSIDYESGAKTDVQVASTKVESAIQDLDDQKLSRNGQNNLTADLDFNTNSATNVGGVSLEPGASIDTDSAGTIEVGGTNATTVNIGQSGQTTVIKGNLQVDGTTTTINSTVLDIDDPNVTVNKGGSDATSEGAGFTIERTSTDGSVVYDSNSATKFKAGDLGSEVDLVGTTSTQTLTNKTIDGDDNTIQDLAESSIKQIPANANNFVTRDGAGDVESATKAVPTGDVVGTSDTQTLTDKTLTSPTIDGDVSGTAILDEDDLISDSATKLATQQSIKAYVDSVAGGGGGGSGSGEINYVPNPSFDLNTTDWFVYTAGSLNPSDAEVVEDLGATSTLTRDTVTPISGTASGLFTIDPSDGDVGIATQFTVNRDYNIQKIKVSMYLHAEGDSQLRLADSAGLKVFLFAGGVQQIPATNVSVIPFLDMSANSDSYGKWVGEFNVSTTDTVFKLAIQSGGVSGGPAVVKIDNVVVGEVLPQDMLDAKGRLNYIRNGDFNRGNIGAHNVDLNGAPITGAGAADPTSPDQLVTRVEIVPGTNSLSGSLKFDFNDTIGSKLGEGVAWDFEIPAGDATQLIQQPLEISYLVQANGTPHTLGDVKVYIKDLTGNEVVGEWDLDTTTTLTRLTFRETWLPVASSSKYRLIIVVNSATATLADFAIDDVYVGPTPISQGFNGIWKSYDESQVLVSSSQPGFTVIGSQFIPKKMTDGTWRLSGSGQANFTAASVSSMILSIPGVTFKTGVTQQAGLSLGGSASSQTLRGGYALGSTGNLQIISSPTGTTSQVYWSFADLEIDGKPTWADFEPPVNLINDSLVTSNARFKASQLGGAATPGSDIPFSTPIYNRGAGDFSSGAYTVPAAGTYSIQSAVELIGAITGAITLTLKVNGVAVSSEVAQNNTSNSASIEDTIEVNKGDLISVQINYGAAATRNYSAVTNRTRLVINRIADVSAGSTAGFGLATSTSAGLVTGEVGTTDITAQCSITAGTNVSSAGTLGLVAYSRVGKTVTVSFNITGTTVSAADSLSDIALTLPTFLSRTSTNALTSIGSYWQSSIQPRVRMGPVIANTGVGTNSWVIRGTSDSGTVQSVSGTFTFNLDW